MLDGAWNLGIGRMDEGDGELGRYMSSGGGLGLSPTMSGGGRGPLDMDGLEPG